MSKIQKFYIIQAIAVLVIGILCVVITIINIFAQSKVLEMAIYIGFGISLFFCFVDLLKLHHDFYKEYIAKVGEKKVERKN